MRPGDDPTQRIGPPGSADPTRRIGPAPTRALPHGGAPSSGGPVLAGRYRLEGLIGSGGMADVHRATDLRLGRPVAIKIFRPGTDPEGERRFREEARTLANLRHPGLVAVHDVGTEQHRLFLVMELVDGPTLHDELTHGPLAAGDVTRIGLELAQTLAAVHDQGVVHRDVKPSNVLLDPDGRVRLTDFGIARLADSTGLNAADVTVGTPAYLSPEQVRGTLVGPPADVYSLGLVLLEALTGRPEYPANSWASSARDFGPSREFGVDERLSRPPVVPRATPQPLRDALHAMTVTDPVGRPSAREVAGMLARPAGALEAPSLGSSRRGALAALGAVAVLVAVLVVVLVATRPGSESERPVAAPDTTTPVTTERAPETGRAFPGIPTALPKLPSLPNLPTALPDLPTALPSLPTVPQGVQDDARNAWEKFTGWFSSLF